jgi:MFS family permease
MGIAAGPFALIGFSLGGAWADSMWGRGRRDAHMTVGLWVLSIALPLGLLVSLTSNTLIAIPGICVLLLLFSAATPAAMAGLQLLCPPHFRGRVSAIFMVVLNLAGVGLGPLLIGVFNDYIFLSKQDVGKSLALMLLVAAPVGIGAFAFCRARLGHFILENERG